MTKTPPTGKTPLAGKSDAGKSGAEKSRAEGTGVVKAAAEKAVAETAGAVKAVAKKVGVEKTTGRGTAAKKAAAEKTVAKKAAAGGSAAKKAVAKKAVANKAGAEKAVADKAVAKKAVAKKAGTEKAVTKKALAKEAPVESPAVKKAAAKKTTAKKATAEKTAAKKVTARKTAVQRTVGGKSTSEPATTAEPTTPAPAKKPATRKSAGAEPPAQPAAATPAPAEPVTTTTARAKRPTARKSAGAKPPAQPAAAAPAHAAPVTTTPAPAKKPATRKTAGAKPPAQPVAAAPATTTPAPPPEASVLDAGDRERLLSGAHHDPHSVLGAHPVVGGVAFRVFRPYALGVSVVAGDVRAELHDDGDGFFSGALPLTEVPDYRLLVTYEGAVQETEDAYAFLPALGDLDLHLIGEGRHEQLWTALGAQPMTHQGVDGTRFTVWAPNARGVRVAGTFNFWDPSAFAMRSLGATGVWELFVPGVGEGELYKFEITRPDGSKTLRADPLARRTEVPPNTSSIIHASHHEWGDEEWLAQRAEGAPAHQAPFSVYEIHLPSWRPGLTYRQLAEQLPAYVKDLGFTHVELMPVAEHPFGGSWGYQVTGFYAPTARLGTPDDFKYLIDALHQAGIGVLMDWVPAHFPRDDWALAEFDGRTLYEHEDPLRAAHPDWGTLEFDYGRREVRNFLVANAIYWCEEFHIDGLRVDAVASMLYLDYSREPGQWVPNVHGGRENLDAVDFLQEMNATVYRRVPGVVTIAEESTAWDGVTRATHHMGPGGFGGLGFGLKWNMGWMHDSLGYMAHEPVHRKYHHHEMTFSMVYAYSENYVLPISHDEVVHGKRSLVSKMPGDWWQQRANLRAYLAFMWAHPGKQLLFMGQEFAQGAEWSEAHGPDWWLLDPAYGAEADHRGVRDLVRDLNIVYRHTPALWQRDTDPSGFQWIVGDASEDNVFAFLRYDAEGNPLLAVSNLAPVVRPGYRLGVPDDIPAWTESLNTDTGKYGGGDITNPDVLKPDPQGWHGRPASLQLTLPPLATVWLRPA
ncbi:1,4-alpha-glucan branching enzyme [Streptomyces griseorubiginosus]|uniref:1,4-alpha-glucan branching enzyme n=1 Tax=Streptomyces griseorubiginosus TaxID=67304 RepID=UPI002E8222C1|nr:1,4-alpha-glucan branching enzyme [Streptomyces griseorubiginosus]WUB44239.1 1,4-alpha-glucan branching enzyme [Streptomyces griseorubiginosus]WUB52757.1 1,4-alpha-glucan branching enzyme [Streptomyces griseorubiginosus]